MKQILIIITLLFPLIAHANPSPFGLTIGVTSIKEAKAKYPLTKTGTNQFSRGDMFEVDVAKIKFEGLKSMTLIFNQKGILVAMLTHLPKHKFNTLLNYMQAKYQVVSKQIPFVGNKKATYKDDQTEITLIAPHMSFEMEMNYIHLDFMKKFEKQFEQQKQKVQKNEQNQL